MTGLALVEWIHPRATWTLAVFFFFFVVVTDMVSVRTLEMGFASCSDYKERSMVFLCAIHISVGGERSRG